MKKLFACLVALLAIAPVVANAASYTKGDYINFAGNSEEWELFKNAPDSYALNYTGNGTIYIEDSNKTDDAGHKYLRVINLFALSQDSLVSVSSNPITSATVYTEAVTGLRESIKSPYGYATDASTGIDVDIATATDIKTLFGVDTVGQEVTLTGDMKTFFGEVFASLGSGKTTLYMATKTASTTSGKESTHVVGLKITKSGDAISKIELADVLKEGGEEGAAYSVFPVVLMNEAYVCSAGTEETYSCYECPTTGDQTEYVWKVTGSQDAACKVVDTVTTKSNCAKNAKTGVDSYLIPAAIILGVCAIVLTVVKRKDAFRAI